MKVKITKLKPNNDCVLPDFFKILFWDSDFAKVNLGRDRFCIIERALRLGRPEHIIWILDHFTEKEIGNVVKTSRNLDLKTTNYWALRLKINPRNIRCLKRRLTGKCFG